MPFWGYVIIAVCTTVVTGVVLPTHWHIRAKLLEMETRLKALETWQASKDEQNERRYQWMSGIDNKLDAVCEDTAEIKGYLKGRGGNSGRVRT